MLPDLLRRSNDPEAVRRLERVLRLGPWLWPSAVGPELQHACSVTRLGQPPQAVAELPAVTVQGTSATLWAVCDSARPGCHDASLGPAAIQSWEAASLALPRSLPVLWTSLSPHLRPPTLVRLESHGPSASLERSVDGPSLGLTFFLLLSCRVTGVPVPQDVIGSAAIDAMGSLQSVDGLAAKIEAVVELAPGITRFVVSVAQKDEAESCARGRIKVVAVRTAAEAASTLTGAALVEKLVQAGNSPNQRYPFERSLLRLAFMGRGQWLDWSPVERAATVALGSWLNLSASQRFTLSFVASVAARHQGNRGALGLPPEGWLSSFPLSIRHLALAHLVQHSADTGTPPPDDVLALASPELRHVFSSAPLGELRLAGAVARLEAVTGRVVEALATQEALARAHLAAFAFEDVSMPLCEWLRLAVACGDQGALDRARAFHDEFLGTGLAEPGGLCYLRLALARARDFSGEKAEARSDLEHLAGDFAIPDHVRLSAKRWLAKLLRDSGDGPGAAGLLGQLAQEAAGDQDCRILHALASLDAAIAAGDSTAGKLAVQAARDASAGLVGNLLSTCQPAAEADTLARLFPY